MLPCQTQARPNCPKRWDFIISNIPRNMSTQEIQQVIQDVFKTRITDAQRVHYQGNECLGIEPLEHFLFSLEDGSALQRAQRIEHPKGKLNVSKASVEGRLRKMPETKNLAVNISQSVEALRSKIFMPCFDPTIWFLDFCKRTLGSAIQDVSAVYFMNCDQHMTYFAIQFRTFLAAHQAFSILNDQHLTEDQSALMTVDYTHLKGPLRMSDEVDFQLHALKVQSEFNDAPQQTPVKELSFVVQGHEPFGMQCDADFTVTDVAPRSLASRMGLEPGMRLIGLIKAENVEVQSTDLQTIDLARFWTLLQTEIDNTTPRQPGKLYEWSLRVVLPEAPRRDLYEVNSSGGNPVHPNDLLPPQLLDDTPGTPMSPAS